MMMSIIIPQATPALPTTSYSPATMSNNPALPESTTATADPFSDDMDQFAKTVANIKSKNVRPDLLPSIITHFASKWLPELCSASDRTSSSSPASSSTTAAWLKKRFLVENLVSILPIDGSDSMPCDFLLRLLRAANMVGAGPAYVADVEARVACQLDRASLNELMIPAFNHTSGTLLDVGMVVRMVGKFMGMERSGAATVKVAKLVDLYMAEVALDAGLTVEEFERLAGAVPAHARAVDDGVYRAVDTYMKVS